VHLSRDKTELAVKPTRASFNIFFLIINWITPMKMFISNHLECTGVGFFCLPHKKEDKFIPQSAIK